MTQPQKPSISTARLTLRPFSKNDREAVLDLFSDAETMVYWSREPISTLAEADTLIGKETEWGASDSCFNWAIALADSDSLVGKISLFQLDTQNRRAEIGYILNRKQWGNGYMTEAMARVLDFAFDILQLHRIEADTDPDNRPSLALLEKFGFAREGLFRDRWWVHGKWHDSVMLGLLESVYREKVPDTR